MCAVERDGYLHTFSIGSFFFGNCVELRTGTATATGSGRPCPFSPQKSSDVVTHSLFFIFQLSMRNDWHADDGDAAAADNTEDTTYAMRILW